MRKQAHANHHACGVDVSTNEIVARQYHKDLRSWDIGRTDQWHRDVVAAEATRPPYKSQEWQEHTLDAKGPIRPEAVSLTADDGRKIGLDPEHTKLVAIDYIDSDGVRHTLAHNVPIIFVGETIGWRTVGSLSHRGIDFIDAASVLVLLPSIVEDGANVVVTFHYFDHGEVQVSPDSRKPYIVPAARTI